VAFFPCTHSYRSLHLETQADRGYSRSITAMCMKCDTKIPERKAMVMCLNGLRDDLKELRESVSELGVVLPEPALKVVRPRNEKEKDCPHYVSWLSIGEKGGRGPQGIVRCSRCAAAWPDYSSLIMIMKSEIQKLQIEIRRLKTEGQNE